MIKSPVSDILPLLKQPAMQANSHCQRDSLLICKFVLFCLQVTIIDGKTGKPIIKPSFKTSVAANTSPLTVSMEGEGNDLFAYWVADCLDHEGEGGEFEFVEGTNVHEQSRADTCQLRYQTKSFSRLSIMNRKTGFPGQQIYHSGELILSSSSSSLSILFSGELSCSLLVSKSS